MVKFNEDNTLELGETVYNYHKVNRESRLYSKRDGKFLVFDSLNNLQEIKWYQNGRLFYYEYYLSEKGSSSLDTFYNDSFKIEELKRPVVELKNDLNDSSLLVVNVFHPGFPTKLLVFGCNCNLILKEKFRLKNESKLVAKKKTNGEEIVFNVGYQNWNMKYERKDTFYLKY